MKTHTIRTSLSSLLLIGGLAACPGVLAAPQLQTGWPVAIGAPVRGAVALGNIAGDARLEAVVGATDSKLYALNPDGTDVSSNWPVALVGSVGSAPALADLDGDGLLEIVVLTHESRVYVLRGDGSVMPGWPQTVAGSFDSRVTGGMTPSPVLANLDADPELEILVAGSSQMDVFEITGTRWGGNWPVPVSGYYGLLATPAVADLDNDGQPEIVMCARSTWTGTVYAFETDGSYVSGFNQFQPGNYIDAAPVIFDWDGDGFKEIVICGEYNDNKVYLLDHRGNLKSGWPVATKRHQTPPAIADVDGDGQLEIVVANRDDPDGPGYGWIYAIKRDRSFVSGFPFQTWGHFDRSAPVLADINGDGLPEIIAGNRAGNLYAVDGNAAVLDGWPFAIASVIDSSLALGDTDLDGRLEVVFGADDGQVYCLDLGAGSVPRGPLAWPTFHYNNQRTGFYDACPKVVMSLADDGPGSLRQTLLCANAGSTITFAVTGTIVLTSGELSMDKSVTLAGPGAAALTISGNNASRVFFIASTGVVATISGLTLANGYAANEGGAIRNLGRLTLLNCVLTNNAAGSSDGVGQGGGIYSSRRLTAQGCVFAGNRSTGNGGAIRCNGEMAVTNCAFANNQVNYYGAAIYNRGVGEVETCVFSSNHSARFGGAIWNENNLLTVHRSTFAGNVATVDHGGAIANQFGHLRATLSTFSGNRASYGGAISHHLSGTVTLTGCTIVSNRATRTVNSGGGVFVTEDRPGAVRFRNTILAGNTGSVGPDCQGTIVSDGWNFVGDDSGSLGFTNGANCDQVGTAGTPLDPRLGPLRDNGGPTPTHALQTNSPALDMGHGSSAATEQRGGARIVISTSNPPCGDGSDIGAFEAGGFVRLWLVGLTNGIAHLQFTKDVTVSPVSSYHIERRFALGTGDWEHVQSLVGPPGTVFPAFDPGATNGQSFYRVRVGGP